jgi:hypothetical protein
MMDALVASGRMTGHMREQAEAAWAAGRGVDGFARTYGFYSQATYEAQLSSQQLAGANDELKESTDAAAESTLRNADGLRELSPALRNMVLDYSGATQAAGENTLAMEGNAARVETAIDAFERFADAQQGVADATAAVQAAEAAWAEGAGNDVANLLENKLGPGTQNYRDALGIVDDVMGTSLGTQADYEAALAELVKNFDPANPEAFKGKLEELKGTYGNLDESVMESKKKLEEAKKIYDSFTSKDVYLDVWPTVHPPGTGGTASPVQTTQPGETGTRPYAEGGDFDAGQPMLVGEEGPEVIVPKGSGTVVPNNVLGGPTVTIIQNFYGPADAATVKQAAADGYSEARRARGMS